MQFLSGGLLLIVLAVSACSTAPSDQHSESAQAANIHGLWRIVANTPSGNHEAAMHVDQSGSDISGRFEGALGVVHYTGKVEANTIRFSHNAMAGVMKFDYEGKIEGDAMKGTAEFGTLGAGTWIATRQE